ncbi:hypothetical protein ACWEQ7_36930 [Streptomyces sp. NPDC004069]
MLLVVVPGPLWGRWTPAPSRAAMASPPISGGAAAGRIADALGTPNVIGERA